MIPVLQRTAHGNAGAEPAPPVEDVPDDAPGVERVIGAGPWGGRRSPSSSLQPSCGVGRRGEPAGTPADSCRVAPDIGAGSRTGSATVVAAGAWSATGRAAGAGPAGPAVGRAAGTGRGSAPTEADSIGAAVGSATVRGALGSAMSAVGSGAESVAVAVGAPVSPVGAVLPGRTAGRWTGGSTTGSGGSGWTSGSGCAWAAGSGWTSGSGWGGWQRQGVAAEDVRERLGGWQRLDVRERLDGWHPQGFRMADDGRRDLVGRRTGVRRRSRSGQL